MVNGTTTNAVTIGQLALRMVLRHVDNQVERMVGNHVHHIVLTLFVRPCYGRSLHAVIVQETGCTACSVNLIALLHQFLGRLQQANLALGTTT